MNNIHDIKAYESQLKGDNYDNTETLVAMNYESTVNNPSKQYDFRNREKLDDVQVVVNRTDELDFSLCSESSKVGITAARKGS